MVDKQTGDKIIKQLALDLSSKDDKIVLSALKRIKSKGDASLLSQLFQLFQNHPAEKIKKESKEIITSLKTQSALNYLIKELDNPSEEIRLLSLQAIWSSGLDVGNDIARVIKAAIDGSYLECIEIMSILDNIDYTIVEEEYLESVILLKEYWEGNPNDDKKQLIQTIEELLLSLKY